MGIKSRDESNLVKSKGRKVPTFTFSVRCYLLEAVDPVLLKCQCTPTSDRGGNSGYWACDLRSVCPVTSQHFSTLKVFEEETYCKRLADGV